MKELRDRSIIQALLREIQAKTAGLRLPVRLMEVCGTHTMTIHRFGLKIPLSEAGVEMLSGPGCPVCITPDEYHEASIDLVSHRENVFLCTFGDMTRVPTRKGSLQRAIPASGSRVRIVYSPEESLDLARSHADKTVVFFGVGFETTIPSIALTGKTALEEKLDNFSILSALWIIPPPLRAILESSEASIQGFLYPGHVSAIIGEAPYRFIADEFGIPGAIAGFEPVDILLAVSSILDQIRSGRPAVANEYARVVAPEGNRHAQSVIKEILEPRDAHWRGLGMIPGSGLSFRPEYGSVDAEKRLGLRIDASGRDLPGCRCGEVLRGRIGPRKCPLFGKACTPDAPRGPCMVSFEGACLADFKYGLRTPNRE